MKFTPGVILLVVAVVLFLLAAFGIGLGGLDLVTLGLAAFAASFQSRHADIVAAKARARAGEA